MKAHWIFESLAYATGFWLYRRDRRRAGDFLATPDRFTIIASFRLMALFTRMN